MAGKRILIVSMGEGGNRVASAFLDMLLAECGVGPNGEPPVDPALAAALEVFCDRRPDGRLVPRRLLAATSPGGLGLDTSRYAGLYPAEAKVLESAEYGGKNWAKGQKAPTVETLVEMADERIAALDGECILWLFHALGGGYGSGGGSRFLDTMLEHQGDAVPLVCIPILPSPKISDVVVEPYNAALALNRVLNTAQQILLIDNDAVYDTLRKQTRSLEYRDLNAVIATALYTLVSPMLWPDPEGGRLTAEAFHANLWNAPPDASWAWASPEAPRSMRLPERLVAISQAQDAASPAESDASLAARLAGGREKLLSAKGSEDWMRIFAVRYGEPGDAAGFASAIPGAHARLAIHPGSGRRRAVAAGAHAALLHTLKSVHERFVTMYARKAFLHWYTGEGINEMEFTEAESMLTDAACEVIAAAAKPQSEEE